MPCFLFDFHAAAPAVEASAAFSALDSKQCVTTRSPRPRRRGGPLTCRSSTLRSNRETRLHSSAAAAARPAPPTGASAGHLLANVSAPFQASSSTTPVSRNSVRSERTSRLQDPVNIHQPTSVSQGISTPIPAGSPGLSNLILDSASNSALLSQSNQKR
ncbi:uncharacterized protein LOC127751856 isoform X1 [Frankliniella occidentalis]|uniref:Uncharacterized protein LOC127751856 isoform X1 n=1 Tax=Frankliniella occidentalis TaxID=133901 RepID=A0A9C6XA68_FRAOC|nr:uncharacterized protein LOC127751856 isoform X1 [Frankliniella occidentalis]